MTPAARRQALVMAGIVLGIAVLAWIARPPGRTVVGVVTGVEGDLTTVTSFSIRTEDGTLLDFVPDEDGDFAFDLPHLRVHLIDRSPVEVRHVTTGHGTLLAVGIDDA